MAVASVQARVVQRPLLTCTLAACPWTVSAAALAPAALPAPLTFVAATAEPASGALAARADAESVSAAAAGLARHHLAVVARVAGAAPAPVHPATAAAVLTRHQTFTCERAAPGAAVRLTATAASSGQ